MFKTGVFYTALILLYIFGFIQSSPVTAEVTTDLQVMSTSGIIDTSPVPQDYTTELQNTLQCDAERWAECVAFLEGHLNKDSKECRQVQVIKDTYIRLQIHTIAPPEVAVGYRYIEFIEVLLRYGVPVNKKYGIWEETVLHTAAEKGRDNIVTLVLTQGADIQAIDKFGNTPLHKAASHIHSTTVKLLLDAGAQVNVTNNSGKTPLYEAVSTLSPLSYDPKYFPVNAELFVKYNAEFENWKYINAKKIIELLLEHGADVNIPDFVGKTSLHVAAEICNSTIVKLLIDGGANINATDNYNQTPLHKATESNNMPVVEYLVTMSCDKTVTDLDKKTALDIAEEKNFTEIVDLLSRETNNILTDDFLVLAQ